MKLIVSIILLLYLKCEHNLFFSFPSQYNFVLLFMLKGAKEQFEDIFGQHIFSVQKVQPKVISACV